MRAFAGLVSAAALVFTVACSQSDAGITTNVKTKMAADDVVKAYQVDVTTRNRVVTLSGDVDTSAARDRAIEIARGTGGVTDVIDQLRVRDTAATSCSKSGAAWRCAIPTAPRRAASPGRPWSTTSNGPTRAGA